MDPARIAPGLQVRAVERLDDVPAEEWNRVAATSNPFVRHEFLAALERHGCAGEGTGWSPCHLLATEGGHLTGALPLYSKRHSFGEFVFDWAWAEAYARLGESYYPKLVSAVPFAPVTGPRLLLGRGAAPEAARALIEGAVAQARDAGLSSVHCLFPRAAEARALEAQGLLLRTGCQFHWTNPGYADFEDFLATLNAKRRKQIRRERRDAGAASLDVRMLRGDEVSEAQWAAFHRFYCATFERKWGMPSLTLDFFKAIGRMLPHAVLLALAARGDEYVAGALFLRGDDALYGRHWGTSEYHPALHFELCYYRGIDYCIREGLARFEAGAQGEHKIWRGFLPVRTWSAHWIRHPRFRDAVADFLSRERAAVTRYIQELQAHSPYRSGPEPGAS